MQIISITVSHSVDYLLQQFPCRLWQHNCKMILFSLSLDARNDCIYIYIGCLWMLKMIKYVNI